MSVSSAAIASEPLTDADFEPDADQIDTRDDGDASAALDTDSGDSNSTTQADAAQSDSSAVLDSTQAADATEVAQTNWWNKLAEKHGIPLAPDAAEDDYLESVANMYRENQEVLPSLQQRLAEQERQIAAFLAQQQTAQPQPAAQPSQAKEVPNPFGKAPEYDPAWLKMMKEEVGENGLPTGNFVALPGAMPDLPMKVQAYHEWVQGNAHKLATDPISVFQPLFEHFAPQAFEKMFNDRFAEQQRQAQIAQIVQANRPGIFVTDKATGQQVFDTFGQPRLTPAGHVYTQTLKELEAAGVTDPATQDRFASMALKAAGLSFGQPAAGAAQPVAGAASAAAPAQPAKTAAQVDAERKQAFLNGQRQAATRVPSRGGPAKDPETGRFIPQAAADKKRVRMDDIVAERIKQLSDPHAQAEWEG